MRTFIGLMRRFSGLRLSLLLPLLFARCTSAVKFRHWLTLALITLLSACETELPQGQIRIVGAPPPATWYVGSPFSYTFGLDGGSGVYQVRYSKTPPQGSNFEPSSTENTVDMQVEIKSGPKSEFTLFGTPRLADPTQAEQFDRQEFDYYITVTDGNNTRHFRYTVGLEISTLSRGSVPTITESRNQNTRDALLLAERANLIEQNSVSRQVVCESVRAGGIPESLRVGGREAGYSYWQVELRAPVGSRTEVFYRTKSRYNENLGELDPANAGLARPGVDFVAQEDSMVFQPGERFCTLRVAVFDDALLEANETFELEFSRIEGDPIQRFVDSVDIDIVSDESAVSYEPEALVLNRGDAASFTLSRAQNARDKTQVLVGVDAQNTNLAVSSFELLPLSGVLEFDDQTNSADVSVSTNLYPLAAEAGLDPKVTVLTSVDVINELEQQSHFVVNEWGTEGLNSELVGSADDGQSVVDIEVSNNGIVFALGAKALPGGSSQAELKAYFRNGIAINLAGNDATIAIAKAGLQVQPIGLAFGLQGQRRLLAVAVAVEGRLVDAHYGGRDFAIYVYELLGEQLNLLAAEQYGSELDDQLSGLAFDDNGSLYAFGTTPGTRLNGAPGSVLPSGGVDGFVYKINPLSNAQQRVRWSRFIGSVHDDGFHGLAVGNNRLVAGMTEAGPLPALKYYELSSADPLATSEFGEASVQFGSAAMRFSDLVYEDNLTDFYAAGSGPLDIGRGAATSDGSRVVSLAKYEGNGGLASSVELGTRGSDEIVALAQLPGRDQLALLAYTSGQLSGQQSFGQQDIVFASYESESELRLIKATQFGTAGLDEAIDLEVVGEDKYLVLWRENSSAGNGSYRYRISAFSPNGTKLGPNP